MRCKGKRVDVKRPPLASELNEPISTFPAESGLHNPFALSMTVPESNCLFLIILDGYDRPHRVPVLYLVTMLQADAHN